MTDAPAPSNMNDVAEIAVVFSGPAVRCNRFFFTPDNVCRLTFLEQSGPDAIPIFRGAYALSLADIR